MTGISFFLVPRYLENDTFYTIRVGERIVNEGFNPIDDLSIHEDLPYTYPHWLFDVIIYGIYCIGGFEGIYLFKVLVFILCGMLLYYFNKRITDSKVMPFFLMIVSILLLHGWFAARAQILSYILFACEIFCMEMYHKEKKKRYLVGLVFISLAMVSMHMAVWPLFFVLFLPYFITAIKFNFICFKTEKYSDLKGLGITFLVCLLTGFLHPIPLAPYTYTINTFLGTTQNWITEHAMLKFGNYEGTVFLVAVIVFAILWLIAALKVKVSTKNMALACGMIILAITSQRHAALLTVLICFVDCILINEILKSFSLKEEVERRKGIFFFMGLVISLAICAKYANNTKQEFINLKKYPVYATAFMQNTFEGYPIRIYNEYNYGSYLIFKGLKPFIDSRADLYTLPFNQKEDLFETAMNTQYGRVDYHETFEKYQITHVFTMDDSYLDKKLSGDSKFLQIYSDPNFSVYEVIGNGIAEIDGIVKIEEEE